MRKAIVGFVPFLLIMVQFACNLPPNSQPPPSVTLTPTPFIQVEVASAAPILATETPTPVPAPQDQLVLRGTLCWRGPGAQYVVVSSLDQGERVKLLGVGSIPGWYIVENPTYHDLCWVQATDLQIDPGIDPASLKVYSPPPLKPTKTPKPTPTPV